jgi:hypothetical protein
MKKVLAILLALLMGAGTVCLRREGQRLEPVRIRSRVRRPVSRGSRLFRPGIRLHEV